MILIIIAFALSLIFMFGGWSMLGSSSHGMGGIAGLIAGVYPGVLGLLLACLALVAIPVIKGASVYLAWGSCIATVSVLAYTLISALIGSLFSK